VACLPSGDRIDVDTETAKDLLAVGAHELPVPRAQGPIVTNRVDGRRTGRCIHHKEYGGDAKKCMDAVAKMIDAKTKNAGLL